MNTSLGTFFFFFFSFSTGYLSALILEEMMGGRLCVAEVLSQPDLLTQSSFSCPLLSRGYPLLYTSLSEFLMTLLVSG